MLTIGEMDVELIDVQGIPNGKVVAKVSRE